MKVPDKYNVLIVTSSYPLQPDSSSGIFVAQLAKALAKVTNIFVITPSSRQLQEPLLNIPDAICFRYAPLNWQRLAHEPGGAPSALKHRPWLWLLLPAFLLSLFWATFRLSRKTEVIHAQWSINGLIATLAGRLRDRPVVTTLRGSDVHLAESGWLTRYILQGCLFFSDHVTVVSSSMREMIVCRFPKYTEKISFIPNGIDSDWLKVPPPPEKTENSPLMLLGVGSLVPDKGWAVVLRAIAHVRTRIQVHFTLVGDGTEREPLTALAEELGIAKQIYFAGSIPPDTVKEYMAKAQSFILPSHHEGRPNALLEAMASGRTVLGSDIEGIRELVRHGETGLLFSLDDDVVLAEHLLLLAENSEERQRLGIAARASLLAKCLTWERSAEQYVEIYRAVIAQRNSACAD
jgi:glycosyltransferase involved in cell wall biosynthesis